MTASPKPESNLEAELKAYCRGRPLVLCRLPMGFALELANHPERCKRFTASWPSFMVQVKVPALCLLEMEPDPSEPWQPSGASLHPRTFLAVVDGRQKNASFQTRLKFVGASPTAFLAVDSLGQELSSAGRTALSPLRDDEIRVPLPSVQDELISLLWEKERLVLERLAPLLKGVIEVSDAQRQQDNADAMAKAFFGLRDSDFASGEENHVLEEKAVHRDSAHLPGFEMIETNLQGASRFRKGDEELVIYHAHQGPIEELLGVDLVYLNESQGSSVLVQYKMLEPGANATVRGRDWTFRPDPQFHDEISRMRLPALTVRPDDYRLHRDPFFFKFIRRLQKPGDADTSLILSVDHLREIVDSNKHAGPKGGVRMSFQSLNGQYLRESDFIGLIRSGYIGTHRVETDWLRKILEQVSRNRRGLVIGWQHRVPSS